MVNIDNIRVSQKNSIRSIKSLSCASYCSPTVFHFADSLYFSSLCLSDRFPNWLFSLKLFCTKHMTANYILTMFYRVSFKFLCWKIELFASFFCVDLYFFDCHNRHFLFCSSCAKYLELLGLL